MVHKPVPSSSLFVVSAVAASLTAHAGAAVLLLALAETSRSGAVPVTVRIAIAPAAVTKLETPVARPRSARPAPERPTHAGPASQKRELERAKLEPAPAEESAPVDFSGVTLTNQTGGAGWSSAVGNGKAFTGPVQLGSDRRRGTAPIVPAASARSVDAVPAGDLSRAPVPPRLDGVLQSHYPADARRRGVGGQAVVRARIDPDGRVRSANVLSETEPGFGSACRQTVVGSAWSPPLDRAGRAVATFVSYTCRFRVGL